MYPKLKVARTTTIKIDVPNYNESLADHTLLLFDLVWLSPHLLALGLVIGPRSSSAQVVDSRIPKLRASLESSLRTCIGQLGTCTLVVIQSTSSKYRTFMESNQLTTLLQPMDWGANTWSFELDSYKPVSCIFDLSSSVVIKCPKRKMLWIYQPQEDKGVWSVHLLRPSRIV